MECPRFFCACFILGTNPYAGQERKKLFFFCAISVTAYVTAVASEVVYALSSFGVGSIQSASVAFRTLVTVASVLLSLKDYDSSVRLYRKILSKLHPADRGRVFLSLDVAYFLILAGVSFEAESALRFKWPVSSKVGGAVCVALNTAGPVSAAMPFALCCSVVRRLYAGLRDDAESQYVTTAPYLRRLRLRHADVVDLAREAGSFLGARMFLFFMVAQLLLVQKVDNLLPKAAYGNIDRVWESDLVVFVCYILILWYFCSCASDVYDTQFQVLSTILGLSTKEMDTTTLEEVALLAEDLRTSPPFFSAASCFKIGLPAFYSAIGIAFSYLMIIGPLVYNQSTTK